MRLPVILKLRKVTIISTCTLVFFIYMCISWNYTCRSYYIPSYQRINRIDYSYDITPKSVCSQTYSPGVLVLVLSTPGGREKRQAVRDTWGNASLGRHWPTGTLPFSVKFIFLVGHSGNTSFNEQLRVESESTDDILLVGIREAYGVQVTKKIIMGFKWVGENCLATKHVMKVDDDTFVDLPKSMTLLQLPEWSSSISGHKVLFPLTKRYGKYLLTYEEYPFLILPSYLFGYFYVMPRSVAMVLVAMSEYVPYVRMEDVYITGILSRMIGVKVKGTETTIFDRNYDFNKCDFVSGKHDVGVVETAENMYSVWKTYTNSEICYPTY